MEHQFASIVELESDCGSQLRGLRIWRPIIEILKLVDSCPTRANMEFLDPKMHLAGRVARPY
jgi:hypothetical protein